MHLLHGAVTYSLLHWNKGSPVQLDQGRYDGLTFWEQLDDGVQHTATRKFFTALPARAPGAPLPLSAFSVSVEGGAAGSNAHSCTAGCCSCSESS